MNGSNGAVDAPGSWRLARVVGRGAFTDPQVVDDVGGVPRSWAPPGFLGRGTAGGLSSWVVVFRGVGVDEISGACAGVVVVVVVRDCRGPRSAFELLGDPGGCFPGLCGGGDLCYQGATHAIRGDPFMPTQGGGGRGGGWPDGPGRRAGGRGA